MTLVKIISGPCNFVTNIKATTEGNYTAKLEIKSDCEAVNKLAALLEEGGDLTMHDVLTRGFGKGRVYEAAAGTLVHNSCPVASGILKAAEVCMGLALPKPGTIEFVE